jgi:glutamate synthase (NADPH/NADH) large chain
MRQGLYNPANEHDACGLGFIAHIKDRSATPSSPQALSILRNLQRGATGADPPGDGAGIPSSC